MSDKERQLVVFVDDDPEFLKVAQELFTEVPPPTFDFQFIQIPFGTDQQIERTFQEAQDAFLAISVSNLLVFIDQFWDNQAAGSHALTWLRNLQQQSQACYIVEMTGWLTGKHFNLSSLALDKRYVPDLIDIFDISDTVPQVLEAIKSKGSTVFSLI